LWQAEHVASKLAETGVDSEIVTIDTQGDQDVHTPLWKIDGVGVFTAAVDQALLAGEVDIGVHSLKDVPTQIHEDLVMGAVLERGPSRDVAFTKDHDAVSDRNGKGFTIATSSRRRSAQWLSRYPHDTIIPLRGNIQTRLVRLDDNDVDVVIMAEAAVARLAVYTQLMYVLDWMVPAPGQGAVCIIMRRGDEAVRVVRPLNDHSTQLAVEAERCFLQALDGGCSSAIGAHASIADGRIELVGTVHLPDGTKGLTVKGSAALDNRETLVATLVADALQLGAANMVEAGRA
jgi:hydroxymethylbilane synthase